MSAALADVLGAAQVSLAAGFLVFLRIGAAMALLPAFGERTVPVRVRLGLSLSLTVLVTPIILPGAPAPPPAPPAYVAAAGIEVVAGLAFGISLRLAVVTLQMAGTIAANVVSLSQLLGGASVDPQPAMSHLLVVGGLALATLTGLHVKLVAAFVETYRILPQGVPIAADRLADWGVAQVAGALALAFSLAAPFVIASLVYNLALGAINRAMPQLMVAFVGAPAITAGGLLVLWLTAPYMLETWNAALDGLLFAPFGGG
ncbi:MAG: flagellar biosynthetic protein FliR [Pseudomonadota bacterium]